MDTAWHGPLVVSLKIGRIAIIKKIRWGDVETISEYVTWGL